MGLFAELKGTLLNFFSIGAIGLKNSSGVLNIRNAEDTAAAGLQTSSVLISSGVGSNLSLLPGIYPSFQYADSAIVDFRNLSGNSAFRIQRDSNGINVLLASAFLINDGPFMPALGSNPGNGSVQILCTSGRVQSVIRDFSAFAGVDAISFKILQGSFFGTKREFKLDAETLTADRGWRFPNSDPTAGQIPYVVSVAAGIATIGYKAEAGGGGSTDWANPGAIGAGTPNSGRFTTIALRRSDSPAEYINIEAGSTSGNEAGIIVPQLRVSGGRFDFNPLDGKAEFRVSGENTQFNIHNSSAGRNYLSIDGNSGGFQARFFGPVISPSLRLLDSGFVMSLGVAGGLGSDRQIRFPVANPPQVGNLLRAANNEVDLAWTGGLTADDSGNLSIGGVMKRSTWTVATLPSASVSGVGADTYAFNGRKAGEGVGAGSGCPVHSNGTGWLTYFDNTVVEA